MTADHGDEIFRERDLLMKVIRALDTGGETAVRAVLRGCAHPRAMSGLPVDWLCECMCGACYQADRTDETNGCQCRYCTCDGS